MAAVVALPIIRDVEPPPLLEPGEYTATYVQHSGCFIFRTAKLRVDFRLLEHPELILQRWYRVSDFRGGRIKAGRHSDLVRELSAVIGQRLRHDRLPVASLAGIYVRVELHTVTHDQRQHDLHAVNRYTTIARIVGRDEP